MNVLQFGEGDWASLTKWVYSGKWGFCSDWSWEVKGYQSFEEPAGRGVEMITDHWGCGTEPRPAQSSREPRSLIQKLWGRIQREKIHDREKVSDRQHCFSKGATLSCCWLRLQPLDWDKRSEKEQVSLCVIYFTYLLYLTEWKILSSSSLPPVSCTGPYCRARSAFYHSLFLSVVLLKY